MSEQEIVIGGIYEIDHIRGGYSFCKAIVQSWHDEYWQCRFESGTGIFTFDGVLEGSPFFGKQIGFDSTYSEEYKRTEKELNLIESKVKHVHEAIGIGAEYGFSIETLTMLLTYIEREVESVKADLDNIKSQSWIEDTSE